MKKPKVVFPYTEAGLGHISPMNAIADKFEELYGDKVECIRSNFYTENGNKNLRIFGERLNKDVVKTNKSTAYGHLQTFCMDLFKSRLSIWGTMTFLKMGSKKCGIKHMDELAPDMVVSTHFATNYFAKKCKCKPLTVVFFPDIIVNPMYMYPCDLLLVPAQTGYDYAIKKHRKRFNSENIVRVPFIIRKQAYTCDNKAEARAKLGFDENKFTVVLVEGGVGIGKINEICKIILQRDLPVTLVPVCAHNEKLYNKLCSYKSKGKTDFRPVGLTDNMFELLSAADLFCGKSGANMSAEVSFFGLPHIITKYASNIERHNGEYYINYVGNALKIFKPEKVVDKIEQFINHPEEMQPYTQAAVKHRAEFGTEQSAHEIFKLLCTKFPELES